MKKKITALLGIMFLVLIAQRPEPTTFSAVILDPLSSENDEPHQLYDLLMDADYEVSYYQSHDVKVSTFSLIPPNTDLLILRVHSSIENQKIWVFSAEPYTKYKYQVEQLIDHLHRAKTSNGGSTFLP